MSFRRAITPSIENTPSVAIRRTRALARLLQARFQLVQVVVGVAQALRFAQAHAVDDAGVVQRVADHRVLLVEQRLEQAAVRVEAGRIEDRVLGAEEVAEPRLQLLVDALRAADEAHRGHAVAVTVERALRGFAHGGVIGQSEIVVRAQVDDFGAAADAHDGALRGGEHALRLEQALRFQLLCLAAQPLQDLSLHERVLGAHERVELCHCAESRSGPHWRHHE